MASFFIDRTLNTKTGKRERIATDGTVKKLTASAYTVDGDTAATNFSRRPDSQATAAIIQVTGNNVYYSLDGTDPAAGAGFEAAVLEYITLDSAQQIKNFKVTQKAAGGALEVLYLWGS